MGRGFPAGHIGPWAGRIAAAVCGRTPESHWGIDLLGNIGPPVGTVPPTVMTAEMPWLVARVPLGEGRVPQERVLIEGRRQVERRPHCWWEEVWEGERRALVWGL